MPGPFASLPTTGLRGPDPIQSDLYRQQTMANQRLQQQQIEDRERQRQDTLARQTALDAQQRMLVTPGNYNEHNTGTAHSMSSGGGGGGARAVGGMAIGGSIYPDISQMYGQLGGNINLPSRHQAPQVPQMDSGFARAKDAAGRQGNRAIEALRDSMTRRGISDSGMSTLGEANILGQVARQGADAEYEAANINSGRQWEANKMDYQGQLAYNDLDVQTQLANRNTKQALLRALMAQLY